MPLIEPGSPLLSLLLLPGVLYHLFALYCVMGFFRRKRSTIPPPAVPVSIIKPLAGVDPGFRENLESFCRQEYPEYEVAVGFTDSGSEGVKMLRERVLPGMDCEVRIVTSEDYLGANRKVSNLHGLARAARHDLLAMSDSDMRADSRYLETMVQEYYSEPNVALVTCLYKVSAPRTPGAALEALTIALDFIPSVLVARRLEGMTFGLGASMLVSKKAIKDIGGFPAIADYLADDYEIGHRLWNKGYRIVLSRVVLENVVGPMTVREYAAHQIRWSRTYRASRPKGYAGYGITHITVIAFFLFILQGPTVSVLSALGLVLALRFSTAAAISLTVIRSGQWLKWLPLLPVKDFVSFGIWLWSFLGKTVWWRGKCYTVLPGGKIAEARCDRRRRGDGEKKQGRDRMEKT